MLQLLKPVRLEPMLRNKRSHHNKKPVHHNEEWPPLTTTRESLHTAVKTHRSQKINKIKKKKRKKEMAAAWTKGVGVVKERYGNCRTDSSH